MLQGGALAVIAAIKNRNYLVGLLYSVECLQLTLNLLRHLRLVALLILRAKFLNSSIANRMIILRTYSTVFCTLEVFKNFKETESLILRCTLYMDQLYLLFLHDLI